MPRNKKPPQPPDDEEETQRSITSLVELLLDVRGPKQKVDLATGLGISPSSLSHSLGPPGPRQRAWRVNDVRKLAAYYEISADAFLGDSAEREEVLAELRQLAMDKIDNA